MGNIPQELVNVILTTFRLSVAAPLVSEQAISVRARGANSNIHRIQAQKSHRSQVHEDITKHREINIIGSWSSQIEKIKEMATERRV